jgi:hypothetical protein
MNNEQKSFIGQNIPRHGYIARLALLCGCSRKTVTRALFQGQQGPISDHVRETFKQLYPGSSNF